MQGPRRIAFINEKGGSAKTTLVSSTAAYLALHKGQRVLAIDLDPQGQLGKVLGLDARGAKSSAIDLLTEASAGDPSLDREGAPRGRPAGSSLPALASRIPGLDVVVSNKSLALFPDPAEDLDDPTAQLARTLDASAEIAGYDFVLFDCPPSFGPLSLSVLRAAHEIVIPVPLTYLALDSCAELLRSIATVKQRYGNPGLTVSLVVPTFYRRTRLAHEIIDKLAARFPNELASTVLGYHVKIDEAQSHGLSIFEYAPTDRGAEALAGLAEEIFLRAPAEAAR